MRAPSIAHEVARSWERAGDLLTTSFNGTARALGYSLLLVATLLTLTVNVFLWLLAKLDDYLTRATTRIEEEEETLNRIAR